MRNLRFYGKDRTSRDTWDQVIGGGIEFNAGAMSARSYAPAESRRLKFGQLPEEYAEEIRSGHVIYIVFSYQTPIMWFDSETGKWRFPRVTYSRTTSQHQSIAEYTIKTWDGEKWNTPECFDDSGVPAEVDCHTDYLR